MPLKYFVGFAPIFTSLVLVWGVILYCITKCFKDGADISDDTGRVHMCTALFYENCWYWQLQSAFILNCPDALLATGGRSGLLLISTLTLKDSFTPAVPCLRLKIVQAVQACICWWIQLHERLQSFEVKLAYGVGEIFSILVL